MTTPTFLSAFSTPDEDMEEITLEEFQKDMEELIERAQRKEQHKKETDNDNT